MEDKIIDIREVLIDKMYSTLKAGKITSTEQLLNFAKAYSVLCRGEIEADTDKPDTI